MRCANGTYLQLYSDGRGVCRVYEMSIGYGKWKVPSKSGIGPVGIAAGPNGNLWFTEDSGNRIAEFMLFVIPRAGRDRSSAREG
jgi:hypothetical protein